MTGKPKTPKNEHERLTRLRQLMILDSSPEPIFDHIVKLAQKMCDTPIALVSLVDESRQWFKANVGFEGAIEAPREFAFCAHAILQNDVFEVQDATSDVRFVDNPLVTSSPHIRFYAGAPINVDGFNIGVLCVIDREPTKLSAANRALLIELAEIISKALMLREEAIHSVGMSSAKFTNMIEDSVDAVWSETLEGVITSWNRAAETMFGYGLSEMIGQPATILFPKNKLQEQQFFLQKLRRGNKIQQFQTERIHKNSSFLKVLVSLSPIKDLSGNVMGISTIVRDVTQEFRLKQMLEHSNQRLRVTMDSIGDAVISTDQHGVVIYLNPVAQSLLGLSSDEAIGQKFEDVFHIVDEQTGEKCANPVERCVNENRVVYLSNQTKLISKNGREYGIEDSAAPIRDSSGQIIGVVLVFHDVTTQRQMAREISYRATHDALTGLLNRTEFEFLAKELISSNAHPENVSALLYIDLDHFKIVNDTCGHAAGDALLKDVANIMRSAIRGTDILARIGGDEFAVILKSCGSEKAMKIAKNICLLIDQYRFHYNNHKFRVGASVGLVLMNHQWKRDYSGLMQVADDACYAAKHAGRNRVHMYQETDESVEAHRGEIYWVSRIEQALEEDRFTLFYQRILPLQEGFLPHVEILIRMVGKSGEIIPPINFLPAAERFYMATRIDRWVLQKVLQWMQMNSTDIESVEMVSINISGQSINDAAFREEVIKLISDFNFNLAKLCFEVTETTAITNLIEAKKFIDTLRSYGIKFSLDDFGSGVSSFGYLNNLSVDFLKIDGQFVTGLIDNKIAQATVRCITEVANATGKRTIAEWVDSKKVADMLKAMGVDYAQGFLIHRPEPLEQLLRHKK